MPQAKRTLVKSAPELWAELTDPGALAGHLAAFGPVRITRTTRETLVEWEGDGAAGSVRLEPSAWGTRVVLTCEASPAADPARSLFSRWLRRPDPERLDDEEAQSVLTACLDSLGSARHRPFSRA